MKKYKHLILCSHGHFAQEVVKAAEMIGGKMNDLTTFSLLPGMSMPEFRNIIENDIKTMDGPILCLVDLYGGTPSTTVLTLMKDYDIDMVTGLNLATLIETYSMMHMDTNMDLAKHAYDTVRDSAKIIRSEDMDHPGISDKSESLHVETNY